MLGGLSLADPPTDASPTGTHDMHCWYNPLPNSALLRVNRKQAKPIQTKEQHQVESQVKTLARQGP